VDSPPPCSGNSNTGRSQTTALFLIRHKKRQPNQNILHFLAVIKMQQLRISKTNPPLDVLEELEH